MVILENLRGHGLELVTGGHRDDAYGAIVLVRVVVGYAVIGFEGVKRTDALVIGNDDLAV